jgi:predicted nucleotidyltransferase
MSFSLASSSNQSSLNNFQIMLILSDLKAYLQEIYQDNFHQLILFGSRARGDHKMDSDIDVLILLKNLTNYSQEIERTSCFIAKICLENNIVISRAFSKLEEYNTAKSPFFLNIKREGIIV